MPNIRLEEMLRRSSCALCGAGVYIDDEGEGRVHCQGCKQATDNCTCRRPDDEG